MNIDFNEIFTNEQLQQLSKYNLIESVDYILQMPGIINIDSDDFKQAFNNANLTGYIKYQGDIEGKFTISKITDEEPNMAILCITYNMDLQLYTVNQIISKIREQYKIDNIIYGTIINNDINDLIIEAFFTKKQ